MPMSSLISQPSKPMRPRMMSLDDDRRQARRPLSVPGGVDDVRDHPHRRVAQPLERLEVDLQLLVAAVTTGSSLWLSTIARPWPGICLIDADHARRAMPSSTARPSAATCIGSAPSARSPMMSSAPGWRTSSSGRQLTLIPRLAERQRQRPGVGPRRLDRRRRRRSGTAGRTPRRPGRRARPAAASARPGRLPGRSGSARRRGPKARAARRSARSNCSWSTQLRLNRM